MSENKILVVGGAGFIGSIVNQLLNEWGYETVVLDNLSQGSRLAVPTGTFIEGNMGDEALLDRLFKEFRITAVMHFAALINVGESIQNPYLYYQNNVAKSVTLLQRMHLNEVKFLIYSSSASIYGNPQKPYIMENHPTLPINPYGRSKLMVEAILEDADRAYGLKSCSLRYFNAAGGDPSGRIKYPQKRGLNLIPIALNSALSGESVTIFGTDYPTPDGTCVRDYIHVYDIATAHLAALEHLLANPESTQYNLGNGQGYSVRQVLETVRKVTKKELSIIEGPRRLGDPPTLVAEASKARRELGWKPLYPYLEEIVLHAWNSML